MLYISKGTSSSHYILSQSTRHDDHLNWLLRPGRFMWSLLFVCEQDNSRTRPNMVVMHKRRPSRSGQILMLIWIRIWLYDQFSTSLNIMRYGLIRYIVTRQRAPLRFSVTMHRPWLSSVCALWVHLVSHWILDCSSVNTTNSWTHICKQLPKKHNEAQAINATTMC